MSDHDGAGGPDRGVGSWFPEPTALQPQQGAGGRPGGPGGPRRTSGTKLLTYALLFVALVGVSLYLRSGHGQSVATTGSSPSPTDEIIVPHLDASWLSPVCTHAEPGKGFALQAGYTSTAGVVAAWEDALSEGQVTSSASTLAIGTPVGVCYIDGPWKVPAEVAQQYAQHGLTPDRGVVVVLQDQPAGQAQVGQPFIVSHKQLDLVRPYVAPQGPASPTATSSP